MGLFLEWIEKKKLNEGVPAGWTPGAQIGHDPLRSSLMKIKKGEGNMPFNGNFVDSGVIATRFGLNGDELAALKKLNLIVRGPNGFNIDQSKFNQIFGHLAQKTPAMSMVNQPAPSMKSPTPPPPPKPQAVAPQPTPLR